ncbi:MAG: membrane protein insertion efficiency factor YidD [Bacteroidota bacterium]|nr:membrane protein insertion efficiency factor YidD [Bacteroidota bacterium]
MRITIIILFLLLNSFSSFSQRIEEINKFRDIKPELAKTDYSFAKNNNNEIQFIFSSLFLFYKVFISSQDAGSCGFTPSCSIYAIKAIQQQGTIFGLINFFDRYSRCNGLSPGDYQIDRHSHLLIDPVRNAKYEKLITK